MFKYRRRRYLQGRSHEETSDMITYKDMKPLRQLRIEDNESFTFHIPAFLAILFSNVYNEYRDKEEKLGADFLFRECKVDPNTQVTVGDHYDDRDATGPVLWHVAQRLCLKLVRYCLGFNADPRCIAALDGTTAFQMAVFQGANLQVLKNNYDDYREAKLQKVWMRYKETLELLEQAGAHVNELDGSGRTALMHVCTGRLHVRDFDTGGAKYYDKQKEDQKFITTRRMEVVQDLLERGADVGIVSSTGESVLTAIAESGLFGILKELVNIDVESLKAICNVQLVNGDYPIHIAARHRHVSIINMILELGADGSALNSKGETAVGIAIRGARNLGSRFTRSEEQRMISVFEHHGVDFAARPEFLQEVVRRGVFPLISAVVECIPVIDVTSPGFQQVLLESAAGRADDVFEYMLHLAPWPIDVLCDVWLVRAALFDPPRTTASKDVIEKERSKVKELWDFTMKYDLDNHDFRSRAISPCPSTYEEREWLTICNTPCVEARTWEDHEKLLFTDNPKPGEERGPFVSTTIVVSEAQPGRKVRTKQGDKVALFVLHRLACLYRIFGFHHTVFLDYYRNVANNMEHVRDIRVGGDQPLPRGGNSGEDPEVRWLTSPSCLSERVKMNHNQMQIGLGMKFVAADGDYLKSALDLFFEPVMNLIACQTFDHPFNLALLVRFCGHVIHCMPTNHPVQADIVTRLCSLMQKLGQHCHVKDSPSQQLQPAEPETGWFGYAHRWERESRLARTYVPDAHADLLLVAREIGKIYQPHMTYFTTVFHEFLKEPDKRDYCSSRISPTKEELRALMPVLKALVHGGFDSSVRDITGMPVIVRILDVHLEVIRSDLRDDDEHFALWSQVLGMLQVHGKGIHWDMPYSYTESVKERIISQFPDMDLVERPDSDVAALVPRLQCIAAKCIATLPMAARQLLPSRVLQYVDVHRPPMRPVGKPDWKFVDKCHEPRDDDYNRERSLMYLRRDDE